MTKRNAALAILCFALVFTITGCISSTDTVIKGESDKVETEDTGNNVNIESAKDNKNEGIEDKDTENTEEVTLLFEEDNLPEIVITINGEEIRKGKFLSEYEQMKILYTNVGVDIENTDVKLIMQESLLSNTISTVVIRQAADREGITISDDLVDERIEEVKSQYPTEEEFDEMFIKLNLSIETFRENIRNQLKTSKFLYKKIGELIEENKSLEFTEREKEDMYLLFSSKVEGMPNYEDAKDEVDKMFETNKVQIIVQDFIKELIDNSQIKIFLRNE